jgi:hypothetical protein
MKIVQTRLELAEHLPKGGVGVEVGVQKGDFAAKLLELCTPRKLYLIDPWKHQTNVDYVRDKSNVTDVEHEAFLARVKNRFRDELVSGQIEIVREFGDNALRRLGRGRLDWVYLDGDHTKGGITRDLAAADYALAEGGFLCGHDYGMWPELGIEVQEAVDAYCRVSSWRMILRTRDDPSSDGFDSYALTRQHGAEQ